MRFGSASPRARQARSSASPAGRPCRANIRRVDDKLQWKVREDVGDDAGKFLPRRLGTRQARRHRERARLIEIVRPFGGRHSVMPPSRPFSARVRTSTAPSARSTTKAAPRRKRPARLRALTGKLRRHRARAQHMRPSTGRARRKASSACRWSRPSPSAPARNRRRAAPAPAFAPAAATPVRRRQFVRDGKRAAPPPAPHCRRPPLRVRRTRWPRPPPPYRGRCGEPSELRFGRGQAPAMARDYPLRAACRLRARA